MRSLQNVLYYCELMSLRYTFQGDLAIDLYFGKWVSLWMPMQLKQR